MYEIIAKGVFAVLCGFWIVLWLQAIIMAAVGYVFDSKDSTPKWWLVKLSRRSYWDGGDVFSALFLTVVLGTFGGALASAVWPLTLTALGVWCLLYIMRSMVRTSKKALQEHVESMHK